MAYCKCFRILCNHVISVCEEVCGERSAFGGEEEALLADVCSVEDARAFVSSVEAAAALEERLKAWMRQVHAVVMESQQLRTENDSSGPQDELEYWKRRAAHFAQIVAKLQSHEVQMTVLCLQLKMSKSVRAWRDLDRQITFCYNEARDNAKFIQSMERVCHALYLHQPEQMHESVLALLQTVRLVHSVSKFYNTTERTSSLMVKVCYATGPT
jgi:dynein heavy chain, axonemal